MGRSDLSLASYARTRKITAAAVHQRIRAGSLPAGAKLVEGKWRIDPEVADAEWQAHTRPMMPSTQAGTGYSPGMASSLSEATMRERMARAAVLELDYAVKSGALVPAESVEQEWSRQIVELRTGLLGLPTAFRQRVPTLTTEDLSILDGLIRETLEALAARPVRIAVEAPPAVAAG